MPWENAREGHRFLVSIACTNIVKPLLTAVVYGFFFLSPFISGAQTAETSADPVEVRPISAEKWKKAQGEMDFSKDMPIPEKAPVEKQLPSSPRMDIDWNFWGNFVQIMAIIIAIAVLAWGIYKIMVQPVNRKIKNSEAAVTFENLEENIHESDLERFLRLALAEENYAQAIRVYYLMTIKKLSEKGLIQWSKEKTNRAYLQEMRAHGLYPAFRDNTRIFERVWYGNLKLDKTAYTQLAPSFESFTASI